MRSLSLLLLISACGPAEPVEDLVQADEELLQITTDAVQPGPFLDLVDQLGLVDLTEGLEVEGTLERQENDDGAWLAGEDYRISRDGQTLLFLDGAIELQEVGELVFLDTAATLCDDLVTEGTWISCEDGPLTLDLSHTLFPLSEDLQHFDASVSGAIGLDGEILAVEGSWSVDQETCALEPTNGVLTVRQGEHHALTWDGSSTCDGCAGLMVQGVSLPAWCPANLP